MTQRKSFIPRDKPKSWCVGIISALVGLLIAGPIMFAGAYLKIGLAKTFGTYIFVICVAIFFMMWLLFMSGLVTGRYKIVEEKDWKEQVW